MSDKECDNYYRLIRLVVDTGTRTLRKVFSKHAPGDIASVLKQHSGKFDKLKNGKNRILTEPQYQLLIADSPDLEKFDISLLVILIRNICPNVETPDNGWDTVAVLSSDITVGGYIIRIRNIRNEVVGHSSNARVSNDRFKSYWAELEMCLKELAVHVDKECLDEIAEEIKRTEMITLTADSNSTFEATLKKWRVEDLYTELAQLNQKADEQANNLQKTMDDVSFIRSYIEGGQLTGNGCSFKQQMAPVGEKKYILLANTEMNQTKDAIENKYVDFCKALGINTTEQQQKRALPPIVNPNALTQDEIVKYSKNLGKDWEIFAIYLGYDQTQIDYLTGTFIRQIKTLLLTMLQKWHDVVARCANENPRKLLAASFAGIDDNRTAIKVLGGHQNMLKEVKGMKPSPETDKKIKDIDFDVPTSVGTMHVVHHLGPSFQFSTRKDLEHHEKLDIKDDEGPIIEEVDGEMDES